MIVVVDLVSDLRITDLARNARPSDVEDMIQRRLEEKSWPEGDGLYPEGFCMGEQAMGRSFESVRMGAK